MANQVLNNITVVGNEEAQRKIKDILDEFEYITFGDTKKLAEVFYESPEFGEEGGVKNSWSTKNIGAKWAYMEQVQDETSFQLASAWYPTKEFAMNLYNQIVEIDPEVAVELRYEDETYDPVGCILVYKNHIYQIEDDDWQYPDEDDFDGDYDEYDTATMRFMDEIYDWQNDSMEIAYSVINEGEGNPFVYHESKT